ncbi:hypothetical protein MC118_003618 [Salmonella enterica]|nr:hypothetical protein [Salmonella enterica]
MVILFNVIFRILHMLMVLMPSQNAFKIWLRQMAEDALLMKRVAADIRLAGEVFRQMSRGTCGHIPGAEQFVEYTLFYAAHSLGWGFFMVCRPAGLNGLFTSLSSGARILRKRTGARAAAAVSGMLMTAGRFLKMSVWLLLTAEHQMSWRKAPAINEP